MLYSDEDVESKVYDPETGQQLTSGADVEHSELDERIRIALEIERMQRTEGWKNISEWLSVMEKSYRDQLLTASDIDKIRRLQEASKVYRSILNYVDHRVLEGKHLQELRDQDPQDWG